MAVHFNDLGALLTNEVKITLDRHPTHAVFICAVVEHETSLGGSMPVHIFRQEDWTAERLNFHAKALASQGVHTVVAFGPPLAGV